MPSTRRTKVRKSMLALVVSFLRDQITSTTKFTAVAGVSGTYPFTQNLWGFSIGTEFFQVALQEASQPALPLGVTLQFGVEQPDESRSMPQNMNLKFMLTVRVPLSLIPTQESLGQQIALLIDQALFRCAGKLDITDFDVHPTVKAVGQISWATVRRQAWEFQKTTSPVEELRMKMDLKYPQPQEEW